MKRVKATLRLAAAFAAVCCFSLVSHAQSEPPSSYALTHAKIFTLAGAPIEDGTLVIKDGKIAAVGTNVEVPKGVEVIDVKGLQVYPGLFDPITQMGLSEISAVSATVDTTETGEYNPDVVAATAISPSSEHIPVTRASGITEVLAVPDSGGFDSRGGGGVIGGQASAIHLAGWTINDMLIKKSVAMVIAWPEIETRTFDFATFTRKEKPFNEAKQEQQKKVNELADYLDSARHYAQAMGHGGPSDYQARPQAGSACAGCPRAITRAGVRGSRARHSQCHRILRQAKTQDDSRRWLGSIQSEGSAPLEGNSRDPAAYAKPRPSMRTIPTIGCSPSPRNSPLPA